MRRWVLSALFLGLAVIVGRGQWLHRWTGAGVLLTSREVRAVELSAEGVSFALPAGTTRVRILVNVELRVATDVQPVQLMVRTGGGETKSFPLEGHGLLPNGETSGFVLGEATVPAITREVFLSAQPDDAHLWLALKSTDARAAVRVLVERPRPALARQVLEARLDDARRQRLAEHLGSVPWDDLSELQRNSLLERRWSRLAPEGTVTQRRFFLRASTPVPALVRPPTGTTLAPGQRLAWTVRGPGVLTVQALASPLELEARVDTTQRVGNSEPLLLAAGEARTFELQEGLTSLVLRSKTQGSLLVSSTGVQSMAGQPLAGKLAPTSRVARFAALDEAGVEWDTPGASVLRVEARSVGAARVDLTVLNAAGQVLAAHQWSPSADASDARLATEPSLELSAVSHLVLQLPPTARRLRLSSTGRGFGRVLRGADLSERARSPRATTPLAPVQPVDRPRWWKLAPEGLLTLIEKGRWVLVKEPDVLVPQATPPTASHATTPLKPRGDAPNWRALQAVESATSQAGWWALGPGVTRFTAQGRDAQTPPQWKLAYLADVAPGALQVTLDDANREVPAPTARGELMLGPLAPGPHRLHVVAPATRLWLNQPISGARRFREVRLFALEAVEPLRFDVQRGPHTRGTQLEFLVTADSKVTGAELELTLDDGVPAARTLVVSNRRTRWRATSGLEFAPLEGTFLTRSSPAMLQAQPVVMRLEDDVPPGSHTVTLRLRGTSQRLFLRAFSWTEP